MWFSSVSISTVLIPSSYTTTPGSTIIKVLVFRFDAFTDGHSADCRPHGGWSDRISDHRPHDRHRMQVGSTRSHRAALDLTNAAYALQKADFLYYMYLHLMKYTVHIFWITGHCLPSGHVAFVEIKNYCSPADSNPCRWVPVGALRWRRRAAYWYPHVAPYTSYRILYVAFIAHP